MRDIIPPEHAGIRFSVWQPGSFHLSAGKPQCEAHETDMVFLEQADLPDGFELKDSTELWVCGECYDSNNDIDTVALTESIVSSWDVYGEHFENSNPPDMEPDSGGFVFG